MARKNRIHADARYAMLQLEAQNANSTPEQWEELREHMFAEAAGHGATAGAQLEKLTAEFDRIRNRALKRRELNMVSDALRAGSIDAVPLGAAMETWDLTLADGSHVTVLAPVADTEDPRSGANIARTALRTLRCPSCRKGLSRSDDDTIGVQHKRSCAAAAVSV